MGNPAWGHGFHKGVGRGRVEGVLFSAAVSVAVSAVAGCVAVGRKLIAKRRAQPSQPPRDGRSEPAHGPAHDVH
jgi:hypothetical protein